MLRAHFVRSRPVVVNRAGIGSGSLARLRQ
jgi:hypothetical protein